MSDRVFEKWEGKVEFGPGVLDHEQISNMHPKVQLVLSRKTRKFGTPACMEERRLSISSTDLSTIVDSLPIRGGNRYRSVAQLILKKLGKLPPVSSPACDHGVFYEPEALRVYEQVTGYKLSSKPVGWCLGPPAGHDQSVYKVPHYLGATPDGVCLHAPILVEIKCPFWKGAIPPGGIPDLYWPQIQCQMAVTGIHTVHLVHYIPPDLAQLGAIRILETKFDPVWWAGAVPAVASFSAHLRKIRLGLLPEPVSAPKKRRAPKKSSLPVIKKCRLLVNPQDAESC